MLTPSITLALSSAAYLRIEKEHHAAELEGVWGVVGTSPRGQVPASAPGRRPPLTHLCHFLLQFSTLVAES